MPVSATGRGTVRASDRSLPESLSAALIAPCGMDCGLCIAHVRQRKPCAGCNSDGATKPPHCVTCTIKMCDQIEGDAGAFCFDCAKFPCARLRQLDSRYRTKYGMSMVENLGQIQETGIEAFVATERRRWTCPGCGGLLCVHRQACIYCGYAWNSAAAARQAHLADGEG